MNKTNLLRNVLYVALVRREHLRDTQVFHGSVDELDDLSDNWQDYNIPGFIGFFSAPVCASQKEVSAYIANLEGLHPDAIRLIKVDRRDRSLARTVAVKKEV